jgi:Ca-activated chloride channel homolog
MKKLSLFLSICLISSLTMAQVGSIIKGQIIDEMGNPIVGVRVVDMVTADSAFTDEFGVFLLTSSRDIISIEAEKKGFVTERASVKGRTFLELKMRFEIEKLEEEPPMEIIARDHEESIEIMGFSPVSQGAVSCDSYKWSNSSESRQKSKAYGNNGSYNDALYVEVNTESYSGMAENNYRKVSQEPLSTFSIDVDRASYSNVRRFINQGQLPPADAVRIEEMINYFDYEYDAPSGDDPVNIFTEITDSPFNEGNLILHVGVKAKSLEKKDLPPSNLVFLIDVSGSMNQSNKLPLLKSSLKMLVQELGDNDKVAIVVYAGAAGLVLESTSGSKKRDINAAIDRLNAGGSTAGGEGINLAYDVAMTQLIEQGNNRVILATDGDFNVGASSDVEMEKLIEDKRNQGIFLTVLGFGMGNYKDSKMEILADKGNGNYAYIDNITEANKTLVKEYASTLHTVAKDVKIQVEFNPANVAEYRLIGYENRMLESEDFNNDKKDAGEMGLGHVVTALYEIVPVGKTSKKIDPLKYVTTEKEIPAGILTNEIATLKLRYKEPSQLESRLITEVIRKSNSPLKSASNNLRWSLSIAGFGMLLRGSEHAGNANYDLIIKLAQSAIGKDDDGYRREAVQLMKNASLLEKTTAQR